jgi:hypothetical protein
MAKYHVTVERVMRDVLTIEADDEDEAGERADAMFCELHGEHDYDNTTTEVEDADDDAELSEAIVD